MWVHYFTLRHSNCDYRVVITRRVDGCFSGKSWHIHFRPPIKFSDSMVRVSTMTLYFSPLILPRVRCPLYLRSSYACFEMRSPFSMVREKHPLIRLHRVEKSISRGYRIRRSSGRSRPFSGGSSVVPERYETQFAAH